MKKKSSFESLIFDMVTDENKSLAVRLMQEHRMRNKLEKAIEKSADAIRYLGGFDGYIDKKYDIEGYEFIVRWFNGGEGRVGAVNIIKDIKGMTTYQTYAYNKKRVYSESIRDIVERVILAKEEEEEKFYDEEEDEEED